MTNREGVVILIEFLLSPIGSCLYKMNFILFFIIKEMIYEKVIEQKFALVDTAYHMIILSCLALRIIHDCQVLTSFVSCRTGGAIPMQVFFFAFSILGQLEATLDSLGSVNQTKIGKDFSYSNIHAVFVWTPGSDWSTVCLDLQGVMSHM